MLFRKEIRLSIICFLMALSLAGCTVTTDLLGSASKSSTITTPISKSEYLLQFGTTGAMFMMSGADTDDDGNLYVSGLTTGDYGTNTQIGTYDGVTAKYSNAGVLQWVAREGAASGMVIGGRVRYANGYVYATGYTGIGIAGQTLTGNTDSFIAKYDAATGNRVWLKLLGSASHNTQAVDLRIDSSGNVFVAGTTDGSLPGQSLSGVMDAFVVKYDKDGNLTWARQFGEATRLLQGTSMGLDGSGNIYLGGAFLGAYDGHTAFGVDGFIIQLNAAGSKQWSAALGSTAAATVAIIDMAVDTAGNTYVTGFTTGDLDGNTKVGNQDQMIAKFNASGVRQWTKLFNGGAGTDQQAFAIRLDSNNHVITSGGDKFGTASTYGWTIIRWDVASGAQVDMLHDTATSGGAAVSDFHVDSEGYVESVGMVWGSLTGFTVSGVLDGFVMRKKF